MDFHSINWGEVKFVLVIGVVVIAPMLFVIWLVRCRARATHNREIEAKYVLAGIEVTSSWLHGGPVVRGTLHGTPFVLTATPGTRYSPALTVISVAMESGGSFAVSRDSSRDSFGTELLEPVFPDATARDMVRALFLLGFDTVDGRAENIRAIRTFEAGLPELGVLRAAVEHLAALSTITHDPRTFKADEKKRFGVG